MTRPGPLSRLAPQVLAMSSHGFRLDSDLRHLAAVLEVRAPEATIFYGGRILEALSGAAVEAVGGEAKPNPFANLTYLEELTLLAREHGYWAHGLRRLGNEVRHLQRPVCYGEAEVAALLVERWIGWFFQVFEAGARLASLFAEAGEAAGPLFPPEDAALAAIIAAIDRPGEVELLADRGLSPAEAAALTRSPTAACLLAEKLIQRNRYAAAEALFDSLGEALEGELRLLQLKAVACNRQRRFDGTIALLQPRVSAGSEDEETLGILAGGYKGRWAERGDRRALEQSHRLYDKGWQRSKKSSYYLGINSATTALFLGRLEAARATAAAVAAVIEQQVAAVKRVSRDLLRRSYWHAATLAEARLIEGDLAAAEQSYRATFTAFPQERGNFGTTARQAQAIIRARGEGAEMQRADELMKLLAAIG